MNFRIGHGFDTHRIEAGEGVTLGGVFIACPYRVIAHSDGDLLIHALCDAVLGAMAAGDIGHLFPDSDPRYKGISSLRLLEEVMRRADAAGMALVNADVTVIAEVPRIAPHLPAVRRVLALRIGEGDINIKATTAEGMGHIGRREGIGAHAVVLMQVRQAGASSI
jgi:2-C-methyl-D-erythritol 2,4-cyclodiphosphate synthase